MNTLRTLAITLCALAILTAPLHAQEREVSDAARTAMLKKLITNELLDAAVRIEYEQLLENKTNFLVTVKYVQKTQSRWGNWDGEMEISGVMIEPTGLVMCSNTQLGGFRARWGGGRTVPTDIKILIGDDTEGLEADFVARDSELDLAWLQIKEPGDQQFAYLNLPAGAAQNVAPHLGQRILGLGRMGKYFGEVWLVSEGRVAGSTSKPRDLYVVRGGLDTDPGLPVYTTAGDLLGFATIQQPDEDEVAGSPPNLTARGRGLILPARTVLKATARAKDILEAEQAEKEAAEEVVDEDDNDAESKAE